MSGSWLFNSESRFWLVFATLALAPVPSHALPTAPPLDRIPAILLRDKPFGVAPAEQATKQRQALAAQYQAFAQQMRARYREYVAGRGTSDVMYESVRFLSDSGLNLACTPVEEVNFLGHVLELTYWIEQRQRRRYEAGLIGRKELEASYDQTLNVEIQLLKANRRAKSPPQAK